MNCEMFKKCLDNYENLSSESKLEMTKHAAECECCAKELDFFLSITETIKSLPKIEPPKDFVEKLNIRIDEEEKKERITVRIIQNIKAYRRQYVAAAACLALVAVITSNSDMLIRQGNDNDGGVISEQKIVSGNDDNTVSSDEIKQTEIVTKSNEDVPQSTQIPAVSENEAELKDVPQSTPNNQTYTKRNIAAAESKSEKSTPENIQSGQEVKAEEAAVPPVSDAPTEEVHQAEEAKEEEKTTDNYGIETASIEPNDKIRTFSVTEDTENNTEEFKSEDYSIVGVGEIANARYVSEPSGRKQNAIGKLKVSAEDFDRAMDIILLYSTNVNGDLYYADANFVSMMLSNLNYEGIDYSNYIPTYEGQITFEVVVS